jgi:hypothetical protein
MLLMRTTWHLGCGFNTILFSCFACSIVYSLLACISRTGDLKNCEHESGDSSDGDYSYTTCKDMTVRVPLETAIATVVTRQVTQTSTTVP